jgi:type IV pilus assembly protein PilW
MNASLSARPHVSVARRAKRTAILHRRHNERGATLVDVVVALVIALFTIIVVSQSFIVIQTIRRSVSAAADAHGTAVFALQTLAIAAQNAGAGIAQAANVFDSCPASADIATTLRPVSLLIADGGRADRPDTLVVRQSLATRALPARFVAAAAAGNSFQVEAVDGFSAGDRVLAASGTGECAVAVVTTVTPASAGVIDVAHSTVTTDLPVTSLLLSLGAASRGSTTRYDVVAGTLRSTDLANADAPNPLLSNVANLKLQYGIDNDGDGLLDTWVTADAAGGWSAATVLAAPKATLDRIKALRIGIVARTEYTDRSQTRDFHWVLFDCERDDKATCPGRLEGTIAASTTGGYRYRVLETVVPLRNLLWTRGS